MKKVKVKRKRKVNRISLLKAQIIQLEGIVEGLSTKIAQLDSNARFIPFQISQPLQFTDPQPVDMQQNSNQQHAVQMHNACAGCQLCR